MFFQKQPPAISTMDFIGGNLLPVLFCFLFNGASSGFSGSEDRYAQSLCLLVLWYTESAWQRSSEGCLFLSWSGCERTTHLSGTVWGEFTGITSAATQFVLQRCVLMKDICPDTWHKHCSWMTGPWDRFVLYIKLGSELSPEIIVIFLSTVSSNSCLQFLQLPDTFPG